MVVTREAEKVKRNECIFVVSQGWYYVSKSVGNTAVAIQEQDQEFQFSRRDFTKSDNCVERMEENKSKESTTLTDVPASL